MLTVEIHVDDGFFLTISKILFFTISKIVLSKRSFYFLAGAAKISARQPGMEKKYEVDERGEYYGSQDSVNVLQGGVWLLSQ
jgi:hypothetical protein